MIETTLAGRIARVIDYKTGGNKSAFADSLGWSKQYLNKLLNGDAIGISVVTAIIEKYADIDARWLLTGEGGMIDFSHVKRMLRAWLELEDYIPVMTPGEILQLQDGRIKWNEDDLARWARDLKEKRQESEERFAAAYAKMNAKNCK